MKNLISMAKRFREEEDGAAMVEYSVLIGLITAVTIALIVAVGVWVNDQWEALDDALQTAAPTAG